MSEKYEWRKREKACYLPGGKPVLTEIPPQSFLVIEGRGDPKDPAFAECVEILYALSYGIRMLPKKGIVPDGYFEYTVYPLEATWREPEDGQSGVGGDKDYCYTVMVRQPGFVTRELVDQVRSMVAASKALARLNEVVLREYCDGSCVQMMHTGSYDDEPASFAIMDAFCHEKGLRRTSAAHREIYLSDPRKVAREKLKTVLRYGVAKA